jgi:hypothetical protein
MVTSTELAHRDNGASVSLFAGASPAEVVAAMTDAANVLADVIKQRRLFKRIGDNDHIKIEAWQTIGAMLNVFAVKDGGIVKLPWPKLAATPDEPPAPSDEPRDRRSTAWQQWKPVADQHDTWQHIVDLHTARDTGLAYGFTAAFFAMKGSQQVGWAEGRCERSEHNWTLRDDYALASMAQTRGQSRAYAAPLRFVPELAGFEGTPAEDMPDNGAAPDLPPAPPAAPALELLDQAGEVEVAATLQKVWPTIDAYGYLVELMKRLETPGVPLIAGRALRGWALWQSNPRATGNVRATDAPENVTAPPPGATPAAPAPPSD